MWVIPLLFYIFYSVIRVSAILDVQNHTSWKFLNDSGCGITLTDRIIGGTAARLGQFPWLAQIGYGPSDAESFLRFKCGGALINKFYVITAAHCVTDIPNNQFVEIIRLGEHNTETKEDCEGNLCAAPLQDIPPKLIRVPKIYNNPPYKHDLALIELSAPAKYNGWVTPICLPRGVQLENTYVGQTAEVAGWGVYDNAISLPSKNLLYIKAPVQPLDKCINAYKKYTTIGSEQLCVGGIVDEDSCAGDSGGALSKVEAINGPPRTFILGIVSFGPKRCGTVVPAIYTRVAKYMKWILDNVSQ